MTYPVLAPRNTWFTQGNHNLDKNIFTTLLIADSYNIPDGEDVIYWDASATLDGSITCVYIGGGNALIIAGNGSGKIALNSTYSAFVESFDVENIDVQDPNNVLLTYSVLAPQDTWFTQGNPSMDKSAIDKIAFLNLKPTLNFDTVYETWDASAAQDGSIHCTFFNNGLTLWWEGSDKIALNPDSSKLFYGFMNVTRITNAHLLDTSNVENFSWAFMPDGIPTQNTTALTEVDVSTWDVSKCTNMNYMFAGNWYLPTIDVSNWDVSKVTNFSGMFMCCNAVKTLDVSNWNVSSGTEFSTMFPWCYEVEELDVSNWHIDASKVNKMYMLFMSCTKIKTLDLRNFPFEKIELSNFFANCSALEELLVPDDWLSYATSARSMFQNLSSMKNLDTSNWDTSNITDMSFMFYGCSSLDEIDVSNWDVSNVTTFDHFAAHANLRRKGIENWNTSSCENMNAMFHNCAEEELDLSGFDTSKVKFFVQMFENSPNLKHIKGMDKWDTSNSEGFEQMFGRCYKLEELDLSSFDTSKAKNGVTASTNGHTTMTLQNFCNDCRNLKWIKLGSNFAVNGDGTNTNAEYRLILPTPSTDYIEGADGLWYTTNGMTYTPTGIPDRTANIYYSSYEGAKNSLINFMKTNFVAGQILKASDLNEIEDELEDTENVVAGLSMDKTNRADFENAVSGIYEEIE